MPWNAQVTFITCIREDFIQIKTNISIYGWIYNQTNLYFHKHVCVWMKNINPYWMMSSKHTVYLNNRDCCIWKGKGERSKFREDVWLRLLKGGWSLFTPREKSCLAGTSPDINFIKCLLPCIVINVINDCACSYYYNYGYCYYCSPYLVLFKIK